MLGNKKSGGGGSGGTTLVSRDTEIVGDIHFTGTLDIEGEVKGNIVARPGKDGLVRVVEKGRVEGEIHAPGIIVNGRVAGNIHAGKRLELAPNARVEGDVFYTLVEMAVGAEVNGRMMHVDNTEGADKAARGGGKDAGKDAGKGERADAPEPALAKVTEG